MATHVLETVIELLASIDIYIKMVLDLKLLDVLQKIIKNLDCSIPEPQISYDPNLESSLYTTDVFQEVKESVDNMHNETIGDFDGLKL